MAYSKPTITVSGNSVSAYTPTTWQNNRTKLNAPNYTQLVYSDLALATTSTVNIIVLNSEIIAQRIFQSSASKKPYGKAVIANNIFSTALDMTYMTNMTKAISNNIPVSS